jgi:hypothetical protein
MKGRIIRPTEQPSRLMYPRVGQIKVGYKNEKGFPQSVDYFIPIGKYAGLFAQAYGKKPSTIQVVFPDDDAEKVCREQYEYRDDFGKLLATGDGETFRVWNGDKYMELTTTDYPNLMDSIEKRYPNKQYKKTGNGWNVTLTMNFIIPCVKGVIGVWQFVTKGNASTIPQIRDVFDAMLERRGFCKGIVFDLAVQFAKTQKPGDASRYPVVSLIPNESEENVKRIQEAYKPVKLLSDGSEQ